MRINFGTDKCIRLWACVNLTLSSCTVDIRELSNLILAEIQEDSANLMSNGPI